MNAAISKIIRLSVMLLILTGCSNLLYVTDKDGNNQIYKMKMREIGSVSTNSELVSHNPGHADSSPDISPDANKIAYSSKRLNRWEIATRNLSDSTGTTETILQTNATSKLIRPRWSCQQNLIAYAEKTPGSDDATIEVIKSDGGGTPIQVANPGTYAGHDWILNDNYIIYSSKIPGGSASDYGLSLAKSDGSGTPLQFFTRGVLPTVSHNGLLLAYVQRVVIASGWIERIYVANALTLATVHSFPLQQPIGGKKIDAIGFTGDDKGLYIATKVASVSSTQEEKRYEVFRTKLDGTDKVRLTENTDYDSHPEGIPDRQQSPCIRCTEVSSEQETAPTQSLTVNGVQITAATFPNGSPASIAITDYCPSNDGKRELKVGWSQTAAGNAQYASISFPQNIHGEGPGVVEITACHYNALRLMAYDRNNNLLTDVQHTAEQGQLQTLTCSGGNISRIDIIGAEIGIRDICYWR